MTLNKVPEIDIFFFFFLQNTQFISKRKGFMFYFNGITDTKEPIKWYWKIDCYNVLFCWFLISHRRYCHVLGHGCDVQRVPLRRTEYKCAFFNVRAALVVNEKVITVAPQSKVSEIVSTTAHTLTVFGFGSFKHITSWLVRSAQRFFSNSDTSTKHYALKSTGNQHGTKTPISILFSRTFLNPVFS